MDKWGLNMKIQKGNCKKLLNNIIIFQDNLFYTNLAVQNVPKHNLQ